MRTSSLTAFAFVLPLAACVPTVNTPLQDIPKIPSTRLLMDDQATSFDPQYKKRNQPSFSDADLAALANTATRIQATSLRLKSFANGRAEFDAFATHLGEQAAALGTAVTAKDVPNIREALVGMKRNCEGCHTKFD